LNLECDCFLCVVLSWYLEQFSDPITFIPPSASGCGVNL
jgi:hypothetical protein